MIAQPELCFDIITILKYTRMIDNNNHVVVLRLIIFHITVQLIPARRGESSLSWPLSFMCLEGVCAATDSELHQLTYWVDNLMHFNMVLLKGFDPSFPPWKGSVLASRRQEHIWYPVEVTLLCLTIISRMLYYWANRIHFWYANFKRTTLIIY